MGPLTSEQNKTFKHIAKHIIRPPASVRAELVVDHKTRSVRVSPSRNYEGHKHRHCRHPRRQMNPLFIKLYRRSQRVDIFPSWKSRLSGPLLTEKRTSLSLKDLILLVYRFLNGQQEERVFGGKLGYHVLLYLVGLVLIALSGVKYAGTFPRAY